MSLSTNNSESYGSAAATPSVQRGGLLLFAFVVFGILSSIATVSIADRVPKLGAAGVALILLLAIPAGALGIAGTLHGFRKLMVLRKQLAWWHWMWALIACSALVFRFARNATEVASAPLDAWAMLRVGPEGIVMLVLVVRLVLKRPNWLRDLFTGLPKWMAIFSLICLATTMWSVYPAWTAYKSIEFLFDVGLLAAILASVDSVETYTTLLDWTWILYGAELVSAWLGSMVWPSDAWVNGRLEGVFPIVPYNAVGETGALLAVVAFCRLLTISGRKRDRSWYSVLFIFGGVSLFFSQTRNAIGGLLLGMMVALFFMRRWVTAGLLTLSGTLALVFTSLGPAVWTYLQRDQSEKELMSLTGRMEWWTFAWQQFLQHPFTGLGAYAGGKFAVLAKLRLNNGAIHSDLMEIIVGTGIWGVLPALIALIGTWWFLIRAVRNPLFSANEQQHAIEGLGVMGLLTLHSFFNVELVWHAPLLFFVVLGYAEMLRRRIKVGAFAGEPRPSIKMYLEPVGVEQ
jgi:O-antigen ligase